jgi:putative membrane protein
MNEPREEKAKSEDPRVRFAGERTLLAWIRTGLAMMGFGFVVARFGLFLREVFQAQNLPTPVPTGISLWIGVALVILGVVVVLAASWQHVRFLRRLDAGQPYQPPSWSLGVVVGIVLALLGVGMTAYLLLLG